MCQAEQYLRLHTEQPMKDYQPPLLHDLLVAVAAPSALLCAPTGEIDATAAGGGAQGLFHGDLRALARARLTLDGVVPDVILGTYDGPTRMRFVGLPRNVGERLHGDLQARVDRYRELDAGRLRESVVVTWTGSAPLPVRLQLHLGTDLQFVGFVKSGREAPLIAPAVTAAGELVWANGHVEVVAAAPGATVDPDTASMTWDVELLPREPFRAEWEVRVSLLIGGLGPAPAGRSWARPEVTSDDPRLAALVDRSLHDLHGLRMAAADSPDDVFLAAGAPWFFTLFGRDSLWAARMLLPLGTDLARGTLRSLARWQGRRDDPSACEEPGKILHELRADLFDDSVGLGLPPLYYGSVDATPLWICLLHDAWRWGMADADVVPLLPNLLDALQWMERATERGDGLLAYRNLAGRGLANQGWKDSGDAMRFRDGRFAAPPVALAEVQGYAHEAAVAGAALLDAFGLPGASHWRDWADRLAARFRESFWTADDAGPYPAMALDGTGSMVDPATSNMGHLLGTGLLDEEETELVARRVTAPDLTGGYGLRTMSPLAEAYSPLSYHCGSVWPHDTAVVVAGLARSGHGHRVGELVEGLLSASAAFDGRLPELWSGDARTSLSAPACYPTACRPQAWSAAAAVSLLTAIVGIGPDRWTGEIGIRPVRPSPVGAVTVRGLRAGGRALDVHVDADGRLLDLVGSRG